MKTKFKRINNIALLGIFICSSSLLQTNKVYSMEKAPEIACYGMSGITKLGVLILSSQILEKFYDNLPSPRVPEFLRSLYQRRIVPSIEPAKELIKENIEPAKEAIKKINFENLIENTVNAGINKVKNFHNRHKYKIMFVAPYILYKLMQFGKNKAENYFKKDNDGRVINIIINGHGQTKEENERLEAHIRQMLNQR